MAGYGQQVHIPTLRTASQHFLVEVKLVMAVILVQRVQVLLIPREAIGEGEGELSSVLLMSEGKLELTLQFSVFPEDQGALSGHTGPL